MGAIWLRGERLVEGLTELVGYKLGVGVTEAELRTALGRAGVADAIPQDLAAMLRMRSEDYEELTGIVLSAFGDPDAASNAGPPVMSVLSRVKGPDHATALAVIDAVIPQIHPLIETTPIGQRMDPSPILDSVRAEFGDDGVIIASALFAAMNARILTSPWTAARRRDWHDVATLHDLFVSEATTAALGTFFDQRFVDYLHANFDDIDEIHWRRFEALVGEFLNRAGLHVVLGPGRADDGVDIRAWVDGEESATVLVQCKRERRKVTKAVVKALAADVIWEGSRVGLLATTSWWSPGARTTAQSRAYPVEEVDRDALRRWISLMRTPGEGLWLAR